MNDPRLEYILAVSIPLFSQNNAEQFPPLQPSQFPAKCQTTVNHTLLRSLIPLGNLVTVRVTRRKLGIAFFDQAGDSEMRSKMRINTK